MWCYRYRCPACRRLCATDANFVRPSVQCACGCEFKVPKTAWLALRRDICVDMRRIVRCISRN